MSGSGKSSLALGVLYAEGSRRYLEALSTYTRRRMTQASKASVDEVLYVPAALALHQRPGVPGIRSTFGTGTELLNSLRLMYSRLASHRCPNGHYLPPTLAVAAGKELVCPECGAHFYAPVGGGAGLQLAGRLPASAAARASSARWTWPSLVPDESLTIDEGAVAPWNSLMWSLMTDVCREMGVRTDVPFRDLTDQEKDIVYHGPAEKKHIFYHAKNSNQARRAGFHLLQRRLHRGKRLVQGQGRKGHEAGGKVPEGGRLPRLRRHTPVRGRPCAQAAGHLAGRGLPDDPVRSLVGVGGRACRAACPRRCAPWRRASARPFESTAKRLMDLGLGYLTLDRSASTLSTGERQRMQLARAVRNRTTGVLYVLDEPSIGLHPSNIVGLTGVMHDLVADGNSVILVDHDTQILKEADWIIEMGPEAGAKGGHVIAAGHDSRSGGKSGVPDRALPLRDRLRQRCAGVARGRSGCSQRGRSISATVADPHGQASGGGHSQGAAHRGDGRVRLRQDHAWCWKAWSRRWRQASTAETLPAHIRAMRAEGIRARQAHRRDAHRHQRPLHRGHLRGRPRRAAEALCQDRRTPRREGYKASDFSYNTGSLRCPGCDGTGVVSLDVQFLPDVDIPCPDCRGSRYAQGGLWCEADEQGGAGRLPAGADGHGRQLRAGRFCEDMKTVCQRLQILQQLGLGYLTLGEETPSLSGGEAQRLKLASEIGRTQTDSVFVFDEPTIGLHPLDVQVLLGVFQALLDNGATVVVIEHDLDVIRNADYIIDMGPGGGESGGRIVATGTPQEIKANEASITGRYL